MLAVVHMIQESDGRMEEEEVKRREVGCQWESPEEDTRGDTREDRREVGCQSDSAERRDAAVQVDLLTQQLRWRHTGVCGVAWQCVSVRADEPGGGALLQHCCTLDEGQHSPPLGHPLLPTMHLSPRPPAAPRQPKELQQPALLPSMPLCEPPADVSAPPPGLIAPLSPHLAEDEEDEDEDEEEDEEEGGLFKRENYESFRGNRRSTVTAETERKRRTRTRKRKRDPWSEDSAHSCNMSGEKSQPVKPTNRIARRPGSTACCKRKREDDEKSQPDRREDVVQSGDRSSVQKVTSKTQRGETRQRCTKGGRPEARIKRPQAEGGENRRTVKKSEEEEEEDGVKPVKTEVTERPRRKTVGPPIRYLLESEEWSHGLSATNHSEVSGVKAEKEHEREEEEEEEEEEGRDGVDITERTDSSRVESSEDGGVDRGWQLCQVCGLTFTCPSSLRFHLSVHRAGRRLSCHLCNNKSSRADAPRLHRRRHHHGNPADRQINRDTTTPGGTRAADDKQDEETNTKSDGEREDRSKEEEVKPRLPAPTKPPNWPSWWVDPRTTKRRKRRRQDGEGGGGRRRTQREEEGEKEDVEQPERPRRTMVGPPIRYLLESEEPSRGPGTANQDRARGFKQGGKPQKKNEVMIDRQLGWTVTERQTGPVVTERQTGPVVTERQTGPVVTERQTGPVVTERQTGPVVTERQRTLLPASTKAPDWWRRRKRACRIPWWWIDYQTTVRRSQDAERTRRRQDRDGGRGRKTWREEEEEKEGQTEVRQEVVEQPQRPRRTMVGPPIRYLLESEEPSRGPGTANQDRARGPKERGRPKKVITDSEAGGGASEMTDRSEAADGQTGHMVSERQTGLCRQVYLVQDDMQSGQVAVISPCCVRLQRLL